MIKTEVIERDNVPKVEGAVESSQRNNGNFERLIRFGQVAVTVAVLPWGVWVTGQIYGLNSTTAQHDQWQRSREKAAVATMTDVELAALKAKNELMTSVSGKIDDLTKTVNEIDKRLREHDALTRAKP